MRVRVEAYPNKEVRISCGPDRPPLSYRLGAGEGGGPPIDSCRRKGTLPLVISSELSGTPLRTRAGYGEEGSPSRFGSRARRTMLRAGGALEVDGVPPNHCLFLTGTLPGSTGEAKWAIAAWSGWIVKQLKDWLGTFGAGLYSLYCWEQQERGALHLHYVVHLPCPEARLRCWARFQPFWVALMTGVSDRSGVDVFGRSYGGTWAGKPEVVRASAEVCRKSVAAYLSKYLSKGSRASAPIADADGERHAFYPSRWWGVSRPLLARLAELSYSAELECLTACQTEEVWSAVQEWVSANYVRPGERADQLTGEEYGKAYQYRDLSRQWRIVTAYGWRPTKADIGDLLGPRHWEASNRVAVFTRRTASSANVGSQGMSSGYRGPGDCGVGSADRPKLEGDVCPDSGAAGGPSIPGNHGGSPTCVQPEFELAPLPVGLGGDCPRTRGGSSARPARKRRPTVRSAASRRRGKDDSALSRILEYLAEGGAPAKHEVQMRQRATTIAASRNCSKELPLGSSDLPSANCRTFSGVGSGLPSPD